MTAPTPPTFEKPRSRRLLAQRPLQIVAACCLCLLVAVAGHAQSAGQTAKIEGAESHFFGFSPFIMTGPYTTIQRVRASIDTDFNVRDRAANTLTNLGWMIQAGIHAPRLESLPGKPRFEISGGILIPTNASGVVGSKVTITTGMFNDSLKEETKLAVDYNNSFLAGLGVEFIADFLPVELRVTPGVKYLYLDSRYVGRVESERTFISEAPPIVRNASAELNLVQHFVGPSLRIATEPMQIFGIEADLFLEGGLFIDVAGTRRMVSQRDSGNRRSSFNWEASSSAGLVTAGFRVLLP